MFSKFTAAQSEFANHYPRFVKDVFLLKFPNFLIIENLLLGLGMMCSCIGAFPGRRVQYRRRQV